MNARTSVLLSFAQRQSIMAIRVLALTVVSRLVTPQELGIFLIAQGLVTLGLMFADFGSQHYIVTAADTSREHERRALGAGLITSAAAILAMLALAGFAPSGVLSDNVRTALALLTAASIFTPLTSVSKAVMQRDMRYGELYLIAVVAATLSVASTVALAWQGWGYLSLVGGAAVETLLTSALAFARHRPPWPTLRGARGVLGFGGTVTMLGTIRQAGDAAVPLQVEAGLGLGAVGLYGRAQSVLLLFDRLLVEALSHVLLPALAQRRRTGGDLNAGHARMLIYFAATAWPFFGLLALCAPEAIAVLLGPQWQGAVTPLRVLCLTGLVLPCYALLVPFLVTLGIQRRFLPWQAGVQVLRLALVTAAACVSLDAVCAVIVLERAATAWAGQRVLRAALGPAPAQLAGGLGASAVAASAAMAAGGAARALLGHGAADLAALVACIAAAVPVWLAALFLLGHPLHEEAARAFAMTRHTLAKRRRRGPSRLG